MVNSFFFVFNSGFYFLTDWQTAQIFFECTVIGLRKGAIFSFLHGYKALRFYLR